MFEFATAGRIIFGEGARRELPKIAREYGTRALVVTGNQPERVEEVLELLREGGIEVTMFSVAGEPEISTIETGVGVLGEVNAQMVISVGGGSVIDAGKAISVLATNPGAPLDYLEVIGKGKPLIHAPLPFIAMPTTAGTGAEVTRNAVLASPEHQRKVSLRSPLMLPRASIVDPELTYSMPQPITAFTGMDAITQVIEPFVSNQANYLTDAICVQAMAGGRFDALRMAFEDGDPDSRREMSRISLSGGLALANAKLGAVHGFAGVIGGMFDAPHGAICAALLPHVIETNLAALRQREMINPAISKYAAIAFHLTGGDDDPSLLLEWVQELVHILEIPPLSAYGITSDDLPTIVEQSRSSSSMKGNPIVLNDEELTAILERAL